MTAAHLPPGPPGGATPAATRIRDHELFRQRARAEAARYGSDPWVFVRELLQNARDAGARRIEITASETGGQERFACRDDGGGMTLDQARRYLFALYASSKDREADQAGNFGIGFWSVLRFAPSTLTVRSRAAGGDPCAGLSPGAHRLRRFRPRGRGAPPLAGFGALNQRSRNLHNC